MLANLRLRHRVPLQTSELERARERGTASQVVEQLTVRLDDAAEHRLQA